MPILSLHEHELKSGVNLAQYEEEVTAALKKIDIPGLLNVFLLKGSKGERDGRYAVLWIFESMAAIQNNFGTFEKPKWPEIWLEYENDVLAKFITTHPDKIHFTDYEILHRNKVDATDLEVVTESCL